MKTIMNKTVLLGLMTSGLTTLALADQGSYPAGIGRQAADQQSQSTAQQQPMAQTPTAQPETVQQQQAAPNQNDANQQAQGGMATPLLNPLTAQAFVNDAAIGGRKEIRLSQLALDRSQNAEVRNFATRMVKDHSAANNKLGTIARQEGLSCPATNTFAADDPVWRNPIVQNPESEHGAYLLTKDVPDFADYQTVKHLESLSGRDFDVAYAQDMVNDHIATVNEFEAASHNLSNPSLRQFATDTLPTLRDHSQMAQNLQNELNGQTTETTPTVAPLVTPTTGRK
jgi:putative membrane protein